MGLVVKRKSKEALKFTPHQQHQNNSYCDLTFFIHRRHLTCKELPINPLIKACHPVSKSVGIRSDRRVFFFFWLVYNTFSTLLKTYINLVSISNVMALLYYATFFFFSLSLQEIKCMLAALQ